MQEKIQTPTKKEFFATQTYPFVLWPIIAEYNMRNYAVHLERIHTISDIPYRTWLRKIRNARKEGRDGILFLSHEGRRLFTQDFELEPSREVVYK